MNETSPTEQPKEDLSKIRVVPLVPMKDHQDEDSMSCLEAMCRFASKKGYTVYRPMKRRSSAVHENRNALVAELIKSGVPYTHVLMMDTDMVAPEDTLVRLLEHKVDIVGALCTCRHDPPIPNARIWDQETHQWEEIWQWPDGLMDLKGGGIGTGVILISIHALQQVAEVYFRCLYEKDIWRTPKRRVKEVSEARAKLFDKYPNAYWFRFLPPFDGAGENSEDMTFCWVAQRYAGLKVHVDTTIQPGHLGQYAFGIKDFIAHREVAMDKARKEGRLTVREKDHINPIEGGRDMVEVHRQMFCAATGRPVVVPKVEQPPEPTGKISVLLPSRGRSELLHKSIDSLLKNAAGEVEVLVRLDDDDAVELSMNGDSGKVHVVRGARFGYRLLHEYYNELASKATGDWMLLWNDDAVMETEGWDEKVRACGGGLKVLNSTGLLNCFPIFTKKLYEKLGHVSLQAHSDSWLQVVSRMNGIEEPVDIKIRHLREEMWDERKEESLNSYAVTSPEFFSRDVQSKLYLDVKAVKEAFEQ